MRFFFKISTLALLAFSGLLLWKTQDGGLSSSVQELSPAAGEAQIGGDFTLTNQNGQAVKDSDFRGRVMLVFFGFTRCPDICPVTAASLSQTMEKLGADADKVAPVFISVDPGHDTPTVLKDYFSNFDRRIVGLTGTEEQVKSAAAAYKAYYSAATEPSSGHGEHGGHGAGHDGGNAMVNHSGFIYLMDKQGKYVRHFPYNASAEELAAAVREQLKE